MRGYVLPAVLALLLSAPMLWRLDGGSALVRPGDGAMRAGLLSEAGLAREPVAGRFSAETDGRELELLLQPSVTQEAAPGAREAGIQQADWLRADERR